MSDDGRLLGNNTGGEVDDVSITTEGEGALMSDDGRLLGIDTGGEVDDVSITTEGGGGSGG
jgi:hypothetical protein